MSYQWQKLGRIFNPSEIKGRWWLNEFSQTPSVLVFDEHVRVYFCCRPPADPPGKYVSYIGYFDLDKSNLLKVISVADEPVLNLGGVGDFDEFGTYPATAVRIQNEVRIYYGGTTRCETVPFNTAIGMAASADGGKSFTRFGPGPVLSYTLNEPFVLGSPKVRVFGNKWFMWYSAGVKWLIQDGVIQPVYKLRCALSDDGIEWNKLERNILPNVLEEDECQASADVIYSNGKYHMFFSYRYNFGYKTKGRGYRIGYAVSDNIVDWTRQDEKAGLKVSDEGWDSESVSYAHIFNLDQKIYALYQGNYMGREGLGLAVLQSTHL